MKKKIVVYVLMAFIALFLIFRFVSISNNISLQRGIVRSVSATEHNDIVIELENDSFYYTLIPQHYYKLNFLST